MKTLLRFFGLLLLVFSFNSCEITFNDVDDDDFDNEFKIDGHWYHFDDDAYYYSTEYKGETAYQLYMVTSGVRYSSTDRSFRGDDYFVSAIITGAEYPQEGTFKVGGCAVLYYGDTNPDDDYDFSSKSSFKAKNGKIVIREKRSGMYTIEFEFETKTGTKVEGEFEGYLYEI